MAKYKLFGVVLALAVTTVVASDTKAPDEQKSSTGNREKSSTADAASRDERRDGRVEVNMLEYSVSVAMINYGSVNAKLEQRYFFPDAVEVKTFTLQNVAYRAEKSGANKRLTRSVGGEVDLTPSGVKTAEMTYINHVADAYDETSKTFQKLSTTVVIKEGDMVGGQISSPNFPVSYPNGADLTWLISYPNDNVVRFEMEDYATEQCCDRLTIYDGYNMSTYPLATFEGTYTLGPNNIVFSTEPAIFVRFTSDCVTTNRGFRASFINQPKNKAPVMSCGDVQRIDDNEGYIRSPNYPEPYGENMNCTWSVETSLDTTVKFSLDNFTIGSDDQVAFYEGTTSNPGSRITTLTGNDHLNYPIYAMSNQAFVTFTSGYSTYYADNFVISYTGLNEPSETTTSEPYTETPPINYNPAQCDGSLTSLIGGSGNIYSPGYLSPGYYPSDDYCIWYVSTYLYFDLVSFYAEILSLEYGYDEVKIYNGYSTSTSSLIAEISGYVDPGTLLAVSNSTYVTLTFSSDKSITNTGFNIYWNGGYYSDYTTTVEPVEATTAVVLDLCPSTSYYSGYSGYIQSPNFPSDYYNDMNCSSWVTTPYGTTVRLTVQSFSLNSGDHVYIYNANSGQYLTSFSVGYAYGYSWQAPTNYIQIVFASDSSSTSTGYSFLYDSISESETTVPPPSCGGPMPFNNGAIVSPGFGVYGYSNNMDCVWTVAVSPGTYVLFTIQYFNTEECCDYASINGGTPVNSSGLVATLRGYETKKYEIMVPGDQAWMTFDTDHSVTNNGFNMSYQSVTTDYIPNDAGTGGNEARSQSQSAFRETPLGHGVKSGNGPRKLGKDLWGKLQNKPAYLRKEKLEQEAEQQDTVN